MAAYFITFTLFIDWILRCEGDTTHTDNDHDDIVKMASGNKFMDKNPEPVCAENGMNELWQQIEHDQLQHPETRE